MSLFDNRMKQLRAIAWLEGISYIILLLVAMPVKYIMGEPAMVRYVGLIHGLLFVLFIINAVQAKIEYSWPRRRMLRVLATSLIPFGMIWFDRMIGEAEDVSHRSTGPLAR